jgi:hypothetical protein
MRITYESGASRPLMEHASLCAIWIVKCSRKWEQAPTFRMVTESRKRRDLADRLCERQNKGTQSKAIFGRHLDKVDPIPYLRILRCDDCLCADPLSFQRKHDFQLRTYIHREHTFDVATAKADFVGSSAQRGYARAL